MDDGYKNDEKKWAVITGNKGSKRNAKGSERVKAVTLQAPLAPYGSRRGHLGTNHKECVSRGQENGKVLRLMGAKRGPCLSTYVCV